MRSVKWLANASALFLWLLLTLSASAQTDPPVIGNVPPDPDAVYAGTEYIRQLSLTQGTPPVTWTLLQCPTGAVIDQTGRITGWTPGLADVGNSFDFWARAENDYGVDGPTWSVTVKAPEPLNNGFNANHIFAIKKYPHPSNSAGMGQIEIYDPIAGSWVRGGGAGSGYTNVEGWLSLTFSGAGGSGIDDAYCYTVRGWAGASDNSNWAVPPYDGLNIRKFMSNGGVDTQTWVHFLSGWLAGANVEGGGIRYSSFHDSIFVGVDRNKNATDKALVYELNLGLTQILNVYTGPDTHMGAAGTSHAVNVDVNPRNGTLYMINQKLGDDNTTGGGRGDLVAFNTSSGGTDSYTTLINGQTFAASGQPGFQKWSYPNCVIFREGAAAGDDTLVVFMGYNSTMVELWADTSTHPVDGNGNLQLKSFLTANPNAVWNGQQDIFDGYIHYGAISDGFGTLRTDNSLAEYRNGEANWIDADSPPYPFTVFFPILDNIPPNPDNTVANFEYVRQLTVTQGAPVTWSLASAPAGVQIDQTGRIFGWRPTDAWVGTPAFFAVEASNSVGTASASWVVDVLDPQDVTNNGFGIGRIFAIRNYPNPSVPTGPDMGQIEIYNEADGTVVWGGGPGLGYTNVEGWVSVTFSGTGTNDARCFSVRRWHTNEPNGWPHHNPPYDGFNIREFDKDGNVPNQNSWSNLGSNVQVGNIRYSSFHNTLFVGVDVDDQVTDSALMVEIPLSLGTAQRTYTGPNTNPGGAVNVDINIRDGTLYMVSQRLGDDNASGGPLGDLVAFASGVTGSYTTLINGQTFATDGQPDHDKWYLPNCVIFRQGAAATDDTLVVFTDGNPSPGQPPFPVTMEFWADTTTHPVDVNGNLQLKGLLPAVTRGWNGQQDPFNRDIHYGAMADGFGTLKADNTLAEWRPQEADWVDADSPAYPYVPGLCNNPFADVDYDGDVDQADFAVLQLCYSGSYVGFPEEPITCRCLDRTGDGSGGPDGDIDSFDLVAFELCASGPGIPLNPACD